MAKSKKAQREYAYSTPLHEVDLTKAERKALSVIIGFLPEDQGRVYKGGATWWQITPITVGIFRQWSREMISDLVGADIAASVLAKIGVPETREQLAARHYLKG